MIRMPGCRRFWPSCAKRSAKRRDRQPAGLNTVKIKSIRATSRHFKSRLAAALTAGVACVVVGENAPWVDLFDGRTLRGWVQRNGAARFAVEDGAIVGTTVPGSPNSFLCTEKEYGNFVLELDFQVDEGLNSGVQIRSQSLMEYQNGRVHGYQVEIDPAQKEMYSRNPPNLRANGEVVPAGSEPRRWTGGIYDEARRGWLCDLTHNEPARMAFRPGQWNHFRIEANGDSIRTWINGVAAASLADAMTPNGFIALQVHATAAKAPLHARWKNVRIRDLGANAAPPDPGDLNIGTWSTDPGDLVAQVFLTEGGKYGANVFAPSADGRTLVAMLEGPVSSEPIQLSGDPWRGRIENGRLELSHGEIHMALRRQTRCSPTLNAPPPPNALVLFEGSHLDAWARQKPREWETANGPADVWKLVAGGRLEVVPGAGSIITKQKFGDSTLHVEFRTLGPVNSGVYLQARYEINLKDSYGQTQGPPCGAAGNFRGPGAPAHIPNAAYPPYQWQTLDIEFRAPRFDADGAKRQNAQVTVVLNGVTLYKNLEIAEVKGAAKRLGEAAKGPLMLQEHGSPIQFRNIWIVDRGP
jgi:hypothetical protein